MPTCKHLRRAALRLPASVLLGTLAFAGSAMADSPTCQTHEGRPFCQYTGQVKKSYVNAANAILLYFDTPFASAAEINIPGATVTQACIVAAGDKMDFAKMFYASALMAQATGKTVTVQMWGSLDNYPVCDRIWINNG